METGLRVDQAGQPIRRNIINRFICRYNGAVVFDVRLHEAMAANPFLSFFVRARESGPLSFAWEEDGGAVFVLEAALVVVG
jgi:sulfur-oxidizing protein SoxZ